MVKKKMKKKMKKKTKPKKLADTTYPLKSGSEFSSMPESVKPKITPYPKAGAKVQEFEDLLDSRIAGDDQPPKRGPGRPPKEKQPESEQPKLTLDVVAGVVKIPFELWAIGQDVWQLKLNDDEAARIAEPAKQLLEYYLPKIPVIAYAWLSLSVSAFWVMRTRLLIIQELKKQREKQRPPKPAEPAQPGVQTKFPSKIETDKV